MQLKLTTDYSIRLMLCLARRGRGVVVSGRELAEQTGVTPGYLGKTTLNLRRRGLIRSTQGQFGGFVLMRDPKEITLYEIIAACEKTMKLNRCLEENGHCGLDATAHCKVHAALEALQDSLAVQLRDIKLDDLL